MGLLACIGSGILICCCAPKRLEDGSCKFIKAGGDPDGPGWTLGLGLLASVTPLAEAVGNGHTETVAALLEAGADPNQLYL